MMAMASSGLVYVSIWSELIVWPVRAIISIDTLVFGAILQALSNLNVDSIAPATRL